MLTLFRTFPLARQALLMIGANLILVLSAHFDIPLIPIPVTFQTMALLALAILIGPTLTFFAAFAYLAEGLAGLPVFSGLAPFTQVGGYLLALPFAGFLAGLIGYKKGFLRIILAGIVSSLLILTCGALFLSASIGIHAAFEYGFKPFILLEAIKILAVAVGVSTSLRLTSNQSA